MTWLRAIRTVIQRDLTIERRGREVASVIGPLAAASVFVIPLVIDRLTVDPSQVGRAVFWLVTYLLGMQVALRNAASESPTQRRHLALTGLDPLSRLVGRTLSAALLLGSLVVVLLPLTVLFYGLEIPTWWRLIMPLTLFVIGLTMIATLAGEVTAGLRTRSLLAPLLVIPLGIPCLLGANVAWDSVVQDRSTLSGVLILLVSILASTVAMALSARPLEDATT